MNPSSNSGGLGVPGTKPGVIASGPSGDDDKPKPIVSGPDVSAQPNASMQPSSPVQPGGSVQPGSSMQSTASAQSARQTTPTQSVQPSIPTQPNAPAQPNMRPVMPTQPGVSMQSNTPTRPSVFTRPGMPIRTTSDDPIILDNGGAPRKSKKNWIIGGVLILVAVVTAVLAIVVATRGGGGNANGNYTGENGDFYIYANYLLNGEDKEISSLGGEYDESREYAVVKAFEDKDVNFFNKAKELWGRFYDRIMGDESISDLSKLYGDVETENEKLDFFSKYIKIDDRWIDGFWIGEYMWDLYLENNYNESIRIVEDNYAKLEELNIFDNDAIKAIRNTALIALELYSKYDALGCIVDDEIDDICVENNRSALDEIMVIYAEAEDDVSGIRLDTFGELYAMIDHCYRIEGDFSLDYRFKTRDNINEVDDEN